MTMGSVPEIDLWRQVLSHLNVVAHGLEGGLLLASTDGQILLCNPAMAVLLGMDAPEVLALTTEALQREISKRVMEPPLLLQERKLFPDPGRVVCEEFEIAKPVRNVVRWVARHIVEPSPLQIVSCLDITTEVDLADAYERVAATDLLTGLTNRRGGEQAIRREASRAMRREQPLSLLIFDVKGMGKLNDQQGRAAGDNALKHVAWVLQRNVRGSDHVVRWGGDEFLIILPDTDASGVARCAQRLREALAKNPLSGGTVMDVVCAAAEKARYETPREVLRRLEDQLRVAKTR